MGRAVARGQGNPELDLLRAPPTPRARWASTERVSCRASRAPRGESRRDAEPRRHESRRIAWDPRGADDPPRSRGLGRRRHRRLGSGRRGRRGAPRRGGPAGPRARTRPVRAAGALWPDAAERDDAAHLARRRDDRVAPARRLAHRQRDDGRVRGRVVGPDGRRLLPRARIGARGLVHAARPRRALGAGHGALLRGRRARGPRRGGPGRDALPLDRDVREGGRGARPSSQADAAQHPRVPGVRPLQLRLPRGRQDERRPDLPPARGGRGSPDRLRHGRRAGDDEGRPRLGRRGARSATARRDRPSVVSPFTRTVSSWRQGPTARRCCSSGAAWGGARARSAAT